MSDQLVMTLESARLRAISPMGWPSFRRALMAMTFYPSDHPDVPTACVDKHWRCYYNQKWFGALTADQSAAVLVHEMWHLLRFHFFRAMSVGVTPENRLLWNLVTDAEIHEGSGRLIEMLQTLQNVSPITRESFDPPLKERGTSESWYQELLARESTQTVEQLDSNGQMTRMKVPAMAGGSDSRSAVPGFGHIDGSGVDGLPAAWEIAGPREGGPPGVQPERVIIIQRQVAQAIRSGSHRGDEVGSLERWAEDILVHRVDWREQFRTAFQGVMAPVMGFTQSTYRRMSRRQSHDPRIVPPGSW
jgi:predicted metal-dependent peptidase